MLSGLRRLFGSNAAPASPLDAPGTLVNAYATVRTLPPMDFPHVLHSRRDRSDPTMAAHLDGFAGYALSTSGGEMTKTVFHLRGHIARVRTQASFSVTDDALEAMGRWAAEANAVLFLPDGSVRDPQGRVLASRGAPPVDASAALPHPAEAVSRKERSTARLASRGLRANPHLPPVAAATEAVLRSPQAVLGRAQALLVVALRAESLNAGEPLSMEVLRRQLPEASEQLSPDERAFLAQEDPARQDIVRFGWRYEAVSTLQWALRINHELPFPDHICDAAAVTRAMLSKLPGKPALRAPADVLDALDLTLRLHWITRQAQVDGKLPVEGLDAGVVQERHLALNWLVSDDALGWDDIDTPT